MLRFYYFDAVMTLMHKHDKPPFRLLVCVWVMLTTTGCSWVDSTGAQSSTVNTPTSTSNGLRNAQPVAILEESSLTAALQGEGATLDNWNWVLEDTDVNGRCEGINGFNSTLSADSLSTACASADECTVAIDESSGDGATRFTVRMPRLQAPVALSYRLSTTRDDGAEVSRQQLLCGLSVNEAPLANDDHFLALVDELRVVNAQDPDSLLKNDQDDNDVRNQTLTVLTTPVNSPAYAAQFSLDSEGGFIYQPQETLPQSNTGYVEDSFVYAITDGLHTVNATATIRIVNDNRSPKRRRKIPDTTLKAVSGQDQQMPDPIELSRYFFDPDNDDLSYSITPDTLPINNTLVSVQNGMLTLKATEDDVGQWLVEIIATDGLSSISDIFVLTVTDPANEHADQNNSAPTVTDIRNRIVQNKFNYDVSGFFTDPDGDSLTFTAAGLPEDIAISSNGVIKGRSDDDNRGSWFVRVTANDNRGGSVTDGFLLVIN